MTSKPKFNFLFVCITKTGSATTQNALKKSGMAKRHNKYTPSPDIPWKHPQHYTALENRQLIGEEDYNNRFKFTFVRNPWGRLLSFYTSIYCSKEGRRQKLLTYEDVISPEKFNEWAINFLTNRVVEKCSRKYPTCNHERVGNWPCIDWITDEDGKIIVDFIGRHETLEEDYKKILSLIESKVTCPMPPYVPLKRTNVSNLGYDYKHYYSDETRALVSDYFRKDIEAFDYKY
jgi:chondroitin 4-sulfotransferase 11